MSRDSGTRRPPADQSNLQSPWMLLLVLWNARRMIVGGALVAAVVTFVFLYLSPRQYVASASFVPQEPNAAPAGLGAIAAQFGISAPRAMTTSPQFYADLIESREVLRDVLLTQYTASTKNFRGTLVEFLRIRGRDTDETMTRAVKKLRDLADTRLNRQTGVITVELRTTDPQISREVVKGLLALVNEYNLRRRQSQGRSEREFAEQRLAQAREDLATAERALLQFHQRNRQFGEYSAMANDAARLERNVMIAQQLFVSLSQNYESAKLEEVRNTPVITVLERPEGFVERQARGTVRKTIIAFVGGGFVAALIALARNLLARSRGRRDIEDFFDSLSRTWLGRLFRRRAA